MEIDIRFSVIGVLVPSSPGNLPKTGPNPVPVQKLMRHAMPVTTSLYRRRCEEIKWRAVSSLHVPYLGQYQMADFE